MVEALRLGDAEGGGAVNAFMGFHAKFIRVINRMMELQKRLSFAPGAAKFAFGTGLLVSLAACSGDSGVGPDPIRPQFYQVELVGESTVPARFFNVAFGGWVRLDSATLVPYAVGRTIDQRLINDRTGRGGSGGNTRDTTVARGQMMDIRILSEMSSADEVLSVTRDSTLVDVMVKDTMFIITRPHIDPARVRVDTGYFLGDWLLVPTVTNYQQFGVAPFPTQFFYKVTR